jgi:protein-tyrosine phosphatase
MPGLVDLTPDRAITAAGEVIVSLQYPLSYFTLAAACGSVLYVTSHTNVWWVGWFAAWVGVSYLLLSLIYFFNWPGLLGKSSRGGRWVWAWPLFWPYFLLSEVAYALARSSGRIVPHSEIAPGLYLGRRLNAEEAEAFVRLTGIRGVVDLAAEFSAVPIFREADYLSIPVLDATTPTADQVDRAVAWVERARAKGPVYVHCALGQSRSATVVAAYLVAAGLAKNANDAIKMIRAVRPGVKLHPDQRAAVAAARRTA